MAAIVKVKTGVGSSWEEHAVQGEPKELSSLVNEAIATTERFVTFTTEGGKELSLIASDILSISGA